MQEQHELNQNFTQSTSDTCVKFASLISITHKYGRNINPFKTLTTGQDSKLTPITCMLWQGGWKGEAWGSNNAGVIYFASTAGDLLVKIIDPLNPQRFSSPHWLWGRESILIFVPLCLVTFCPPSFSKQNYTF